VKEITFFSPLFLNLIHHCIHLVFQFWYVSHKPIVRLTLLKTKNWHTKPNPILNQKAEVVVCRESVPSPSWNLPPIFSVRPDFSLLVCKWYSTELYILQTESCPFLHCHRFNDTLNPKTLNPSHFPVVKNTTPALGGYHFS
jgi:hypothetical protein